MDYIRGHSYGTRLKKVVRLDCSTNIIAPFFIMKVLQLITRRPAARNNFSPGPKHVFVLTGGVSVIYSSQAVLSILGSFGPPNRLSPADCYNTLGPPLILYQKYAPEGPPRPRCSIYYCFFLSTTPSLNIVNFWTTCYLAVQKSTWKVWIKC